MKSDLNEIQAFVVVAKLKHFTKAAEQLKLPKSNLSRKVAQLEDRLQTKLIERTTRKLALTVAGQVYFEKCATALSQIAEAEQILEKGRQLIKGVLRITCPTDIAPRLSSILKKDFKELYPDLKIELRATNQLLDLTDNQIDIAIRPFQFALPSMHYLSIGWVNWGIYASPKWLKGKQTTFAKHSKKEISLFNQLAPKSWIQFQVSGATNIKSVSLMPKSQLPTTKKDASRMSLIVDPQFSTDSLLVVKELIAAGQGISSLPHFMVQDELNQGKFVEIFPSLVTKKEQLVAIYQNPSYRPARVTAFVDYMRENQWLI